MHESVCLYLNISMNCTNCLNQKNSHSLAYLFLVVLFFERWLQVLGTVATKQFEYWVLPRFELINKLDFFYKHIFKCGIYLCCVNHCGTRNVDVIPYISTVSFFSATIWIWSVTISRIKKIALLPLSVDQKKNPVDLKQLNSMRKRHVCNGFVTLSALTFG